MTPWNGVRGKRVLMTGGSSGIGLAAARELAARGADLSIVARSQGRGEAAAAEIQAAGAGRPVDLLLADLSSQAAVRRLAAEVLERYPRLEVLVNNAGAIYGRRQQSEDGIELTWAVNHLAPFLLTTLLLDRLRASAPARIITTSSDAHQRGHIPFEDMAAERSYGGRGFIRYGQTKLANILFTVELARRLRGTGVTANSFHPGLVASGFNRNNGALMRLGMTLARPFSLSPEKGAETLVWLVDSQEVGAESGGYFVDKRRVLPSAAAQDADAAQRLWALSEEQTAAGRTA
ncbi:MAG: SDR family NAD(P)-dependent oxidoreductase [Candidatus Dormibacteraeota bacterium]|nr:SDR family NAD(P)-dependent oxidoreductase [Candidatus Dormibacteraeota bacterium]